MIGRIRGKLLEKQAPELLVDVNGVGYEIHAPMTTFYQLPALGESVELFTHLIVREDAHLLYGFASQQDRALFRALIKVNSVGPKLALTILSGMDVADFVRCVRDGNTVGLVKLPGVGQKTAERLVIEMRDRLRDWHADGVGVSEGSAQLPARGNDHLLEAESALISLGYKPQEATKMIAAVKAEGTTSEALIRAALKKAVKN